MSETITREMAEGWLLRLHEASGAKTFFDPPILKIASARDPFWEQFHQIIGSYHWTPQEALAQIDPDAVAESVLVWILPIAEEARISNRRQTSKPSQEWARVRGFGAILQEQIARQFCALLTQAGHPSCVPYLTQPRTPTENPPAFSSRFSERHAAFVAGHGTFSLSAGLITEHGIAHRVTSVVTTLSLTPDTRAYGDDPFAWCTRCGACIRRCPAQAIGPEFQDRDKQRCYEHVYATNVPTRAQDYGWVTLETGCGLCQTAVPCEFRRPHARPTSGSGCA